MNLICVRCEQEFEATVFRGYCDDCIGHYRGVREHIQEHRNPLPHMLLDGKFTKEPSPRSVASPVSGKQVCGLCGSDEVRQGYGIGSGYIGCGVYSFCEGCNSFLDCVEDYEE